VFQKILVPLDLTDRHDRAVATAAELAGSGPGEVTLLHVIELIEGATQEEEQPFYSRLERVARKHLQRYGTELTGRGVRWRAEVGFGRREREVVRYAAEWPADLIILTAPVPDPANPQQTWGSLSYRIGILARCPVLLVK
jgi:nucleotide-binding universal stress UspA family protein